VVPLITRGTYRAMISSLPTPFWTLHTAASAKAAAVAARAAPVCRDLVATMPNSQGGIWAPSPRAWIRSVPAFTPEHCRPCSLMART